jgi:hypothetical protein
MMLTLAVAILLGSRPVSAAIPAIPIGGGDPSSAREDAGGGAAAGGELFVASADPLQVERRARAILAERRFQGAVTRRPAAAPAEPQEQPADGGSGRKASAGDAGAAQPELPAAGAAAHGAALLFEAVLVCVLVALLGALVIRWLDGRRRPVAPAAAVTPRSRIGNDPSASHDLADADRLAAAGRYGEAVHVLLLLAIDRLSRRTARPPAPSRTSRELVWLLPLEGSARDAFAALVALVEKTLFGGLSAVAADFQAAREQALAALSASSAGGSGGSRGRRPRP